MQFARSNFKIKLEIASPLRLRAANGKKQVSRYCYACRQPSVARNDMVGIDCEIYRYLI